MYFTYLDLTCNHWKNGFGVRWFVFGCVSELQYLDCFKTILKPNLLTKNNWGTVNFQLLTIIQGSFIPTNGLCILLIYGKRDFLHDFRCWVRLFGPQRLEKRVPSGEAVVFRHDGDGGFFKWGDRQNGWFTMENFMKIDGGILGNLCMV